MKNKQAFVVSSVVETSNQEQFKRKREVSSKIKIKNNIPNFLFLYTWNETTNKLETSYMKRFVDSNDVSISFDKDVKNDYHYKGNINTFSHAIFIYTISKKDSDCCLIILDNSFNSLKKDYKKTGFYFNLGIMSSYGRRKRRPEAKTIFVTEKIIEENSNLSTLVINFLKKTSVDDDLNEITKSLLN